jgi:hypothetical protein
MSRLNPRGYRKPATGIPASDLAASVATSLGGIGAADAGYVAWTMDPLYATAAIATATGNLVFGRAKVGVTGALSTVTIVVTTGGSSLTSAWLAVWALDGTLLGVTADQTTAWQSTGTKAVNLATATASQAAGTVVLVGMLSTGTTGPTVRGAATAASVNTGLSAAVGLRSGVLTGQTGIPSPLPLGSTASLTSPVFLAVS